MSEKKQIPLSRPYLDESDLKKVLEVLQTPYLSLGPKLNEFEKMLSNVANVKYAVAVNSGTSALHLIIKSLGIKNESEVITTPFSFIASSNSILFENAKPIFVDILPDTYNINPDLIEAAISKNTKAILAVDVFGQPADWDILTEIANKHNLYLIEDSAEALGSEYKGKPSGSFGAAGVFAFYPNKQITTGEGGAIVTDSEEIASLSKSFRNQGRSNEKNSWLSHERVGYNYRLSDINCALGISQLKKLDKILEKRQKIAETYNERINQIDEVVIPKISTKVTKMSWFVYVVRLKDNFTREDRDHIIEYLKKYGIESKNYFTPIHLQPFYRKMFGYKEGDFKVTEFVSSRTIALPFYTSLEIEDIDYVVLKLKEAIKDLKK